MKTTTSLILALTLIISSIILAFGMTKIKTQNNYVTVKGLSEKSVTADRAWWSINAQYGGNTVEEIQSQIGYIQTRITEFLKKHNFSEEEINVESINIYQNNYREATSRLNVDIRISVTTDNVEKVHQASKSVTELIADGILIQSDKWASGPKYYFTKFKDLKKEMLQEATKEAKAAAKEFAVNSDSEVGKIRRANQGVFQILPGNKTEENEVFYVDKIIRVVSTVDYYLK